MRVNSCLLWIFLMTLYSNRRRVFLSLLVGLVLVSVNSRVEAQASKPKPIWAEEFTGDTIDRNLWTYDTGGHGFGNGQLEFNTDRPQNSYIKDGALVIEARRESFGGRSFTSARMHTQGRFAFQYGTLEARIQVPDTADGIWPAFWMLGDNFPAISWPYCGEIDILEIGGKEGIRDGLQQRRINCALHYAGAGNRKKSLVRWYNARVDLDDNFHIYKLEWTPQSIRFLLDDEEFGVWDISTPEFREFHQPFYPILNVAVGSRVDSYTGIDRPNKITAEFPARMRVDWLRLYANDHTQVRLSPKPVPAGRLGVFSEQADNVEQLQYATGGGANFPYKDNAALYLWNNVVSADSDSDGAYEGDKSWDFEIRSGAWFGFGVMKPRYRNMELYGQGVLAFAIKTRSLADMRVGIKSSSGEAWIPLGDENAEFGFARDGKWHQVQIPLSRLPADLRTVHQFFMLSGGAPGEDLQLSIDDVRWESEATAP